MPLQGKVRYRTVKRPGQDALRLAWRGGQVVEVTNLRTGDTHTEAEFKRRGKADHKR